MYWRLKKKFCTGSWDIKPLDTLEQVSKQANGLKKKENIKIMLNLPRPILNVHENFSGKIFPKVLYT